MLKFLSLQNIILIESAEISFTPELNVITGETGAGKSAIMDGLNLVLGERTDVTVIRKGAEKGIIEAVFDIENQPFLMNFLQENGIDQEQGQDLIIRREISASGKGRILINHQNVQLSLLRQLRVHLVHIVGQHEAQTLFSLDHHRKILDLYGDLQESLKTYQECYQHENSLREELDTLIRNESQRLRESETYQRELEELGEANLQEGEEEELYQEYGRLTNSKELSEKTSEVIQALSGDRQAVLTILNRQKGYLEAIARLDPSMTEPIETVQNVILELYELSNCLQKYRNQIEGNPERLSYISDRLNLIHRLKRKYGSSISEIQAYLKEIKQKAKLLQQADTRIEQLQIELVKAEEKTHQAAANLSKMRKKRAMELQEALTFQIRSLNMSKASLFVEVSPQKRGITGEDKVEFFFIPNVGEHRIALKEGASGGELSRILLAIQTLLAGKERSPTLIFDEVDANIGGETATIIGEKLKEISRRHQVICITHFPQVAKQADHHLHIFKQEKENRTVSFVRSLDEISRQAELERMWGGRQALLN